MRYQEWPPLNLWLHGNLGGIGEIFNTIGVMLYATNLGTILQSFSLVAFSCYLANRFDGSKRDFIYLYILTSPVLLFLSTTPKPLLFPQVLTALALYITVSEKNINKKLFILICCLLMGAAQQKLSFILTGGVVGFWAFCKAFRKSKFVFIICLVCFIFFFLPRGIWNLEQSSNSGLISFFSPLPYEFIDYLQNFKENNVLVANKGTEIEFEIPNLFLPISLGTITTTVGFQIFLIFFVRTKNKKFWEVTALTLTAMITIYFFGQFTGRYFFEFILWTSVAFSFLNAEEYKFRVYKRFLLVQGFGMLVGVVYGIFTLFPGVLSTDLREEVLHRYASEFSAINWANQILPENSVVLSGLKSVAFFSNDFLPTDWLWFHSNVQTVSSKNKKMRKEYLHAIKLKKPSFLIVNDSLFNKTDFVDCIGEIYSGPKKFNRATRNPFNSGEEYSVTIYRFHSNLLPSCKK